MTDKELTEWEHQSHVINVLTSREMGAWLGRRDNRLLQEIRQEIDKYYQGVNKLDDMLDFEKGLSLAYDTALAIIDKHIKEYEEV